MKLNQVCQALKYQECQERNIGMVNLGEMIGKSMGQKGKKKK